MAISDSHFKVPKNPPKSTTSSEIPPETLYTLAAVGAGVLVLFVIGLYIWWRIMNREDSPGV